MFLLDKSIKQQNNSHSKVFKLIRLHGPAGKSKLVSLSGYKLSTLNRILYDLTNAGFINTVETGASTGGRKPQLYSINPGTRHIIGVDIARMYTKVALMDLNCNVLSSESFGMFEDSTPEKTVDRICSIINGLCSGGDRDRLLGIGLGAVGPLDAEKGVLLSPANFPNNKWKNVPIKAMLEEKTKLVTVVENGVNAAALGEYLNGAGKGFENIAYINAGIGLRLGLILNGKLLRSINNYGGGFGHLKVSDLGPECYCGNTGCLESLVSIPSILGKFKGELSKGRTSKALQKADFDLSAINFDTFCEAAAAGDALASEIIEAAAEFLSIGMSAVENMVAPELIILGGPLFKKCDLLYRLTVIRSLERLERSQQAGVRFSNGTFEDNAVVVGLGNILLDYYLQ